MDEDLRELVAMEVDALLQGEVKRLQIDVDTLAAALRYVRDRNRRNPGRFDSKVQEVCRAALKQAGARPNA